MYKDKTVSELINICKEKGIKGYSGKKKDEIIALLNDCKTDNNNKKERGQFYTVNNSYILEGFDIPKKVEIIEPFAGKGDLIEWAKTKGHVKLIESYDIDPKYDGVIRRDTLLSPPDYKGKWVLTNPPYLARNKCDNKEVFNKYDTNDLYKAFIYTMLDAKGGIIIIPAGFFLSPRDVDVRCRDAFFSNFKIEKVKYFEEDVFPDTPTTVVAILFSKLNEPMTFQNVLWEHLPSKKTKEFYVCKEDDWIIGGEIYKLYTTKDIKISRYVEGHKVNGKITSLTLNGLDTGKDKGKISLVYKPGYVYPAKDTSRSYATLCIQGRELTEEEQKNVSVMFNDFVNKKRDETWSLFLPQYRESKEYARKRIPFELAYTIVSHLILKL